MDKRRKIATGADAFTATVTRQFATEPPDTSPNQPTHA